MIKDHLNQIKKLRSLSWEEKKSFLQELFTEIPLEELQELWSPSYLPTANTMVENMIGIFGMPLGMANYFKVNGKDYAVPMAVEESSVIAAASYAAKIIGESGGFKAEPVQTIATLQMQWNFPDSDPQSIQSWFDLKSPSWVKIGQDLLSNLVKRGGGIQGVELRSLGDHEYVIHIDVDTCESMGANSVNTLGEKLTEYCLKDWKEVSQKEVIPGLRILTNLPLKRMTQVSCEIPISHIPPQKEISSLEIAKGIEKATNFAKKDIFRCVTHNKGIMNGIDAVLIATGNDWRAVEAACHAYAAYQRNYTSLTEWKVEGDLLKGRIEVPLALGTVGGIIQRHPISILSLKILGNPKSATLSQIVASVGLASNFAALRALASEGIQKGHMNLHNAWKNS